MNNAQPANTQTRKSQKETAAPQQPKRKPKRKKKKGPAPFIIPGAQ